MAIFGFRTAAGRTAVPARRLLRILFSLLVMLTACGCSIQYGRIPPTEKLEAALIPLKSTKADVLEVAGPPRGYGMARMPGRAHAPWTIWFYEYTRASGVSGSIELKMLLIFFEEEIYVSYLWFSSFETVKKIKG